MSMIKKNKAKKDKANTEQFNVENEVIISPTMQAVIKFKSNRLAMIGLYTFVTIVVVVTLVHFYALIIDYDFSFTDPDKQYLAPSFQNLLGTDSYGRDFLIRVVEGGWISIQVGVFSTFMLVILGITFGSIAGFFGGRIDSIIMRGTEIVSAFPFLVLAFTIAAIFRDLPDKTKLFMIIVLLGLITWTGLAKMVRGQILSLRQQEFIVATESLGIKKRHQIMRHLIPNVLSLVVVYGTLTFATSILGEASLSFLNLSISEPIPTWGGLLSKAASNSIILRTAWWTWVFPGSFLFMFIMSINLIGEGLRDAIDPKSDYVSKEQRKKLKDEKKAKRAERKNQKIQVKENV